MLSRLGPVCLHRHRAAAGLLHGLRRGIIVARRTSSSSAAPAVTASRLPEARRSRRRKDALAARLLGKGPDAGRSAGVPVRHTRGERSHIGE